MERFTNSRIQTVVTITACLADVKKSKRQVIANVCALLNSNGGVIIIDFSGQTHDLSELDQPLKVIEQWVNTLVGIVMMAKKVKIQAEPHRIVIYIKGSYQLITVDYNIFLPSYTQVNKILPIETPEGIQGVLFGKDMPCASTKLPVVHQEFVQGEKIDLNETYTVQFKQLVDTSAKSRTLCDRMIGQSNKLLQSFSAFANYQGGAIYVGIKDNREIKGEIISSDERKSIVRKLTNNINKMIWLGLKDVPRKGEHWDINFCPVFDKEGVPVESTFVIVIVVARCPGGVCFAAPESYHVVNGEVERMDLDTWKEYLYSRRSSEIENDDAEAFALAASGLHRQRPAKRCKWSSVGIRKKYYRVNGVLLKLINRGLWKPFWDRLEQEQSDCSAFGVKLVILSKRITANFKLGNFEEAQRGMEEYRRGLSQSEDRMISEAREFLLNSALERNRRNIQDSYEHAMNGLPLVEQIPAGILVVQFYSNLATVITVLVEMECDAAKKKLLEQQASDFFHKAIEHLEHANDFLPSKYDQKKKLHINLTFLLLGGSFLTVAKAETKVEESKIREAKKHLNAVEKTVNDGYAMTDYRNCQYLLARSVLFYRLSQNLAPDDMEGKRDDLLLDALKFAKLAREIATSRNFVEVLDSTSNNVEFFQTVDEKWLHELRGGVYTKPSSHPGSSYERFLLLQISNKEIPKPWTRVTLKIYKKPLQSLRIPQVPFEANFPCNDTFADLMSYVSTENFKNYLLQASTKHSSTPTNGDVEFKDISGEDVVRRFAKQLFNLKIIKLDDTCEENRASVENSNSEKSYFKDDLTDVTNEQRLSGLLTIYAVLESKSAYFVVEPFAPHSLQDVVWFSPSVISSTVTKPLFLIYQILKMFETFHAMGCYCTINSLQNILLGNCLWLHLRASSANVGDVMAVKSEASGERVKDGEKRSDIIGAYEVPFAFQNLGLPDLIDKWVKKDISNFDYLMALNLIAGRRFGDPNYHPVLPWVTDFTTPNGKHRDLTKSKFRINKGDFQLDITFKNVSDSEDDILENPPHHVSGVLSEITYHVYLARRTPKSVLQKHVRAKWEPNEYPSNMQRLQEWTPDECIPEFYTDPTIFKSIHADLPDLGVPSWVESPEEFIRLHRKVLESDYVCAHLHDWIDLTFGYKLVGSAAEKAKNVYLHLVDQHQTISSHGVVQLFEEPHPRQHRHHDMVLYPSMVNLEDGLEHEMRDVTNEGQLGYVEEGQAEYVCDEMSASSWDELDVNNMKVETGEDELSASWSFKKQKLWPRPNLSSLLRLKDNVETTTDVLPTIDSLPISLPIGYGPLEEFDQVELLTKFKLQTTQNEFSVAEDHKEVAGLPITEIPETARHKEIQNICTMLMEMFLPSKMRLLPSNMSEKERFITAKRVFNARKFAVPGIFCDAVKTLFDEGHGFHKRQGFPPLTPELLLQQHVNIIPFPSYFKSLYEFLVEFYFSNPVTSSVAVSRRNDEKIVVTNTVTDLHYTLEQVEIAVKHLPNLLADLNGEGLDLLISYLDPLFSDEKTQLEAFLHLFDPLAANLGPKRTKKTFLKQLLKHYDIRTSKASILLYHQSFLSKLIMRFGMDQFLDHFLAFIVDALSSKDSQVNVDTYSQEEVQGVVLEDYKGISEIRPEESAEGETSSEYNGTSEKDVETSKEDPAENMVIQGENEDSESGVIQQDKSDSLQTCSHESTDGALNDKSFENAEISQEHSFSEERENGEFYEDSEFPPDDDDGENGQIGNEDDDEVETIERNDAIFHKSFAGISRRDSDDDWDRVTDSDFSFQRSVSFHSEHVDEDRDDTVIGGEDTSEREVPEAAAESICWLCPRLGPLLTSNHIIKPLLSMLVKCYVGVVAMGDKGMSFGNANAKWILHCLACCTEIYGEAVIVNQYVPFVMSKINVSSENMSVKGEANLAGALVLLREYICSVSKDLLIQKFEMLCYQAVDQVFCLISSPSITFASEAPGRTFLALLILDILKVVCDILERKYAQDLLAPLISTFFSCFDLSLHEVDSVEQACWNEIRDTFTASLAYNAYILLCKSLGDTYMGATLDKTYDVVWQLCCSVDHALSNHTPSPTSQSVFVLSDAETGPALKAKLPANPPENSPDIETRKDAKSGSMERSGPVQVETRTKRPVVSSRQHLTGNWLKYWKNHLGKRKRIDGSTFSQLRLQTFAGHSDVVKDIHVQDSEHLFLSASRDKTVKLWLLSNHGDGTGQSACSWTTYDHRKPVFAVDVIDVMRQAVSCDGSVHIWDLPTGSSVLRLNFPKSKEAVAMATLPCPSPCVVAGMQNATVRLIDAREGNFGHTWRVTSNNLAGHIRSLCVTEDGTSMAVGFSSGFLSLVDLRGGILTRQWKAHEADIIQVKPYTNSSFVTSSSTQKMELWGHDAVSLCSLPVITGSGESVQSIRVHDKVIISMAGNNRIAWHTFNDKEPTYTHLRLGNDVFKGNMTCFAALPLNRTYLVGSDNGNITLMG